MEDFENNFFPLIVITIVVHHLCTSTIIIFAVNITPEQNTTLSLNITSSLDAISASSDATALILIFDLDIIFSMINLW